MAHSKYKGPFFSKIGKSRLEIYIFKEKLVKSCNFSSKNHEIQAKSNEFLLFSHKSALDFKNWLKKEKRETFFWRVQMVTCAAKFVMDLLVTAGFGALFFM